ncbi:thymidine kinase [Spiroplasma endosymbiont of Amphibalanus improvisus]|uniref:thymidine kinase n=1 Tax=Spiroplasma endosymbiont of Amphibalanus improvisus TaxID=3066327 RepID=UPI00313AE637
MVNILLNNKKNFSYIELITGCMFAGKTEEFIRKITRLRFANYKIQVFKPEIDKRYSETDIVSHSKKTIVAQPVTKAIDILKLIKKDTNVVGVDEVQFFDEEIIKIIEFLADKNIIVIVAGLDRDFKKDPFLNTEKLFYKADFVHKLNAVCNRCGGAGTLTQRLINGKPASKKDPIVLIGSEENYQARCRHCHELFN